MSLVKDNPASIAVYDPFRAQLSDLKKLNESVVFNYETKKGIKDAKSHIYKLKQTKTGVEKARKLEKQQSLEYGRLVDSQAKNIAGQVDEMISVHKNPIDEIERREADRIAKHRALVDVINDTHPMDNAEDIRRAIDDITRTSLGDAHDDLKDEVLTAQETTLLRLNTMLEDRTKVDEDAAELARLKQLDDDRKQQELEESIKQQAIENERKRVRNSKKQTQDEFVTRETELVADAERAERDKKAAEERAADAEIAAKIKADQEAEEHRISELRAADEREANKEHHAKINREAMIGFIRGGLNITQAKIAVKLIAQKKIPNVTISY